jgi:hypothetical protein
MNIDFDAECSEMDYDASEPTDPASPMRLTARVDLDDLAGTLLSLRALLAFHRAPARYPIHRVVRCAARGGVTDLFDDLALLTGLAAQRFDAGALLLDAPGVFAVLHGHPKARYTSCTFTFWTDTPERARNIEQLLLRIVGERLLKEETFTMDWRFSGGHGFTTGASFEELADPPLLDEAYPALGEPVGQFIERYLAARETIVILQGPPGTGKTRLVRAMLAAISRRKGAGAKVLYTADRRALESDRIFQQFITGEHDAFVIEDADHILTSRSSGNEDVHRFLAVADGVVRAQGRKILFTTNLPNVHDIDEALLRPGRCFGNVRTRALTRKEAASLALRLCGERTDLADALMRRALPEGCASVILAELYRQLPTER